MEAMKGGDGRRQWKEAREGADERGEETLILRSARLRIGENDGATRNLVNFINNMP